MQERVGGDTNIRSGGGTNKTYKQREDEQNAREGDERNPRTGGGVMNHTNIILICDRWIGSQKQRGTYIEVVSPEDGSHTHHETYLL